MMKTFKGRITLIYLALVLLSAAIGLTAALNLFRLSHTIGGLLTANYGSIKLVHQMRQSLDRQEQALELDLRAGGGRGRAAFGEQREEFLAALGKEERNISEPGERGVAVRLRRSYLEFVRLAARLRTLRREAGEGPARVLYDGVVRPRLQEIRRCLDRVETLNERAMFRSKQRATAHARQGLALVLAVSLAAVAGGFGASRYFVDRFFRPIDQLKETVKRVRAGDLGQQAQIVYRDEIGELAAEFNRMTRRLMQFEQSTVGQLMAEKHRSLAIVKSISDPLIVLDANDRIQLLNPAGEELFATAEGEALQRQLPEVMTLQRQLLEVAHDAGLLELVAAAREGSGSGGEDRQLLRLPGPAPDEDRYYHVIVRPVPGAGAAADHLVVLLQDITQIKRLEKVRTDFIATISHEFKTPLTSVMMGLSLLAEGKIGTLDAKQRELVATLNEDSEALAKLVNDLLELSKIESARALFKFQPCAVGGLFEKAVKQFLGIAAAREVSLSFDAPDDLPRVMADPEKISWVLNNLIGNALKYTGAGDEIRVSAGLRQGRVCVAVRDTGLGIPSEYLDKLFDKFVQVRGYDLEVRGTGLGLAIAKEIVAAHAGTIWCESRMDEGSTFLFTLGLAE